jgi:3-oxoacyl-[acyl-carrier protein] reductase
MAPPFRCAPVALVTGTSEGLGRALAEKLLAGGWVVHGFARGTQTLEHERFSAHVVDVTDENMVRAAVATIAEAGRIDLLVNNAGTASLNALLLTPGSVADKLMRVNYLGAFHCLQAVGKVMVRQRAGLVVNLTTVAVPLSLEGEAAYVASKAAVEALTKVAAKELVSQGVRVIALGFGPIDTRLTRAVPAFAIAEINHAIGRPQGTTMAQAVDFILSRILDADLKTGGVEYLAG